MKAGAARVAALRPQRKRTLNEAANRRCCCALPHVAAIARPAGDALTHAGRNAFAVLVAAVGAERLRAVEGTPTGLALADAGGAADTMRRAVGRADWLLARVARPAGSAMALARSDARAFERAVLWANRRLARVALPTLIADTA